MTAATVLPTLASVVLGGGLLTAVAQLVKARSVAAGGRANVTQLIPAERDSVIVGGAETAVTILRNTLADVHNEATRLAKRVAELEAQLANRDQQIARLEDRLRRAEDELRAVADELSTMKEHER